MMKEDIENSLTNVDAILVADQVREESRETVCKEDTVCIYLNDRPITTLVASPHQLKELGVGFLISEGLVESIENVRLDNLSVFVYGQGVRRSVEYITGSSGGMSSGIIDSNIRSSLNIDRQDVYMAISCIVSELWEKTGGAHCSVLISQKQLVAKSSDVGRHNTVDKVIGYAILNGIDLSSCILGCTGRQPAGMISKAVNSGIPVVISKAATTYEGVRLAEQAGLTLICRAKGDRFHIYTHPQRYSG